MYLKRAINLLQQVKYRYLLSKTIFRIEKGASSKFGKNIHLSNSKILITKGSTLVIGDNVRISDTNIFVHGNFIIGNNSILEKGYQQNKTKIYIEGTMSIKNNCRLRCNIRVRFKGNLNIGKYTNINEETEIRVDDSVYIGNYNQISYKCIIWDTNTHNIYEDDKRRKLSEKYYPNLGYEYEKPKTKPISIGDDCWIGQEVAILKGVKVNNSSIIGFRTTLSNCEIGPGKIVVSKNDNLIIDRQENAK